TFPFWSRTTTRTNTRFTRTLNVGAVSWLETSAASFELAVSDLAGCAGACALGLAAGADGGVCA
ncbi:MAG: hypothetical protein WA894_10050, partial [Candidatus Acidiferrum sp.]